MSTLGAGPRPIILPVRQEWLDRRREDILAPDLPLVDPHRLGDLSGPRGRTAARFSRLALPADAARRMMAQYQKAAATTVPTPRVEATLARVVYPAR